MSELRMFDKKGGKFGNIDHFISYEISFAGHYRLNRNLHIKKPKVKPSRTICLLAALKTT
jgi:hypothetical protein